MLTNSSGVLLEPGGQVMSSRGIAIVAVATTLALGACSSQQQVEPTGAQKLAFQTAIESGFGSQYIDSLADPAGFQAGTYEAGQVACNYNRESKSRDEFQAMFRDGGGSSANGSKLADPVLDAMSLVIWSAALSNLCVPAAADTNGDLKVPMWGLVLGVVIGLPFALWLLSIMIGLTRVVFLKPQARREIHEFITAWEMGSLTSVNHLTPNERRAVKNLMNRWRTARRRGDSISARDFILREISPGSSL